MCQMMNKSWCQKQILNWCLVKVEIFVQQNQTYQNSTILAVEITKDFVCKLISICYIVQFSVSYLKNAIFLSIYFPLGSDLLHILVISYAFSLRKYFYTIMPIKQSIVGWQLIFTSRWESKVFNYVNIFT